jgi:hypothetical protein
VQWTPDYFQATLIELQSKLLEQSFQNLHTLKGQLARSLASKSVLLTPPLRCSLIPTFLQWAVRCYRRPREHYVLILTVKRLFGLQDYPTISTLLWLYADA